MYKNTVGDCSFKSFINILKTTICDYGFTILLTVVSKLFLVHPCFNGIMILILFLKYFFIIITIKPPLLRNNLNS